jgi:hypothetical protein
MKKPKRIPDSEHTRDYRGKDKHPNFFLFKCDYEDLEDEEITIYAQ